MAQFSFINYVQNADKSEIGPPLFGATPPLFLLAVSDLTRIYVFMFVGVPGLLCLLISSDPEKKPKTPIQERSKNIWIVFGVIFGLAIAIGSNFILPNIFIL